MTHLVNNTSRLAFMRNESLRVAGPTPELFQYIRKHRLDVATVTAHAGYINIALAAFMADTFLFDSDGEPAVVIEALLFDLDREQVTADLVAWPVGDPEAFATAMGSNDGAAILAPQNMVQRRGEPLEVHRSPLAWIKAGCSGCVALKPAARHWLHKAGGPLIAEDAEHGRELRELLGANALRHRILIPNMRAAA